MKKHKRTVYLSIEAMADIHDIGRLLNAKDNRVYSDSEIITIALCHYCEHIYDQRNHLERIIGWLERHMDAGGEGPPDELMARARTRETTHARAYCTCLTDEETGVNPFCRIHAGSNT